MQAVLCVGARVADIARVLIATREPPADEHNQRPRDEGIKHSVKDLG